MTDRLLEIDERYRLTMPNTTADESRTSMNPNDAFERIVVVGGPWPERIGLTGHIVPQLRNEYPWHGCPKNQVVIFIDNDPLNAHLRLDWSCVISRKDIALAAAVVGAGSEPKDKK